jgi:hypothetical protein
MEKLRGEDGVKVTEREGVVHLALVTSFLSALHDGLCGELKTLTGKDM